MTRIKKTIVLAIFAALFFPGLLAANPVSLEAARSVAINWLVERSGFSRTNLSIIETLEEREQEISAYYVFNLAPTGFVIVAADDASHPILGYSDSGQYSPQDRPPALDDLMTSRKAEIVSLVRSKTAGNPETLQLWRRLQTDPSVFARQAPRPSIESAGKVMAVAPLLTTTWGQGQYYNDMCPANSCGGPSGHAYVGCVATALAQVLKKWNYPATGTGTSSYKPTNYPTQTVDFGATTYGWAAMPNALTAANSAVATLMYHSGVAVFMEYGACGANSLASAAWLPIALADHFGYSRSAVRTYRSIFASDAEWNAVLKTELDGARPVLYGGCSTAVSASCHEYVLDGYQGADNYYFHINWGWNGSSNGYYYLNQLTNSPGTFGYYPDAVIGIIPADQMPEPSLQTITVPVSVTLGDFIDLNITSNNTGQPADDGYISLLFPGFTGQSDGQFVMACQLPPDAIFSTKAAGYPLRDNTGETVAAKYLVAEMEKPNWGSGQNSVIIRVYPQSVGAFRFYVRSTMAKQGAYVNSPITSQYLDQQGWEVTQYTVQVLAPTAPPAAFAKTSPASGATSQPTSLTLNWGASYGAASYEYCINTAPTCSGSWTSAGPSTSASLSGLNTGTTYYWQAHAVNPYGTTESDAGSWWSFTTMPAGQQAPFAKTGPAAGATGQPVSPVLSWGSSAGAASYEYCVNTAPSCSGGWTNTGSITSVQATGLHSKTTYYWQVRAIQSNSITEADGGSWWSFATVPPALTVAISSPTASGTFITNSTPLSLGGTASGNVGVAAVNWANDKGGNGTATGTTSWILSVPLVAGVNTVTVTANDSENNTATAALAATYDPTPPSVAITSPTTAATYFTNVNPLRLTGTSADNLAVASVTWSNSAGGSGTASGIAPWSVAGITLANGANTVTVTAYDAAGNTATTVLTVTFNSSDINSDGKVDVLDLVVLSNLLIATGQCSGNCDLNHDGRADVLDLQYLVNVILGIVKP